MEGNFNIILNNVTVKQADKLLLNNISFSLHPGEHLALFGASGSGKSLLAKALQGELFHSGTVTYKKHNEVVQPTIAYIPAAQDKATGAAGYYQQRFNIGATPATTLTEALLKKGDRKAVVGWLEKFQLADRGHTPLLQLSNGELKKMQLIGHLLTQPDILILDNVFTGLDIKSRKALHTVLNQLAAEGITIILITDSHELPASITHFAEMAEGAIVNFAPVEQLGFMQAMQAKKSEGLLPAMKKAYHIGPLISMKNVSVTYDGVTVLNNITWQVNNGACWQIKGPNGAGKSTLLSLINADHPQGYSQQLSLFGKKRGSGESIWEIKSRIGLVSPELQRFFSRSTTVTQAIGSGFFDTIGFFHKLNPVQEQKVREWLSFFALAEKADRRFATLSGGEQRLVLIARALVKDPLLLTLDEPCLGLDNNQAQMVLQLLERIHQETGMTLLFISHYDEEVPPCVKHVLELNKGVASIYEKTVRSSNIRSKIALTRQAS
ncbi:MAG: ATP-binding cassette domain-containing protein [Niabella sp.]|nr:ATP-binding cassette domain-containing protein [Niabella sp.]